MLFCPKCGGVLVPKNEKNEKKMVCTRCGSEYKLREDLNLIEKVSKGTGVIDVSELPKEIAQKTRIKCPECGNEEAYFWVEQTRAADEPPTKIYKCTKCGYMWREYQ